MAYATRLTRRDATRLPRREPTVQLRTDPELRVRLHFKLPDWLLLAIWSFGGLFSSFPTPVDRRLFVSLMFFLQGITANIFSDMPCMKRFHRDQDASVH